MTLPRGGLHVSVTGCSWWHSPPLMVATLEPSGDHGCSATLFCSGFYSLPPHSLVLDHQLNFSFLETIYIYSCDVSCPYHIYCHIFNSHNACSSHNPFQVLRPKLRLGVKLALLLLIETGIRVQTNKCYICYKSDRPIAQSWCKSCIPAHSLSDE